MFNELDTVVVRALVTLTRRVDGTDAVKRQPRVGDRGTVVHVLGPDDYVVECVDATGMTGWLADFRADELAPEPAGWKFSAEKISAGVYRATGVGDVGRMRGSGTMIRLLQRQFEVSVPLSDAWRFLARVEEWPQWAGHIKRVDVIPPGDLGPGSSGAIRLRNGIKSTFRMQEFRPTKSWKWVGPFLWLTVHYDHQFDAVGADRTRLTWVVDAEGFGASVFGRLFAAVYSRNLDKAIPVLVASIRRANRGGDGA